MILSDSIHSVLIKYDFELFRGSSTMSSYMGSHLKSYCDEIKQAATGENQLLGDEFSSELQNSLPKLEEFCKAIPDILRSHEDGHIEEAFRASCALFEEMKPYCLHKPLSGATFGYFRVRPGNHKAKEGSEALSSREALFHIKNSERHKAKACRYSIAGHPSLYLSSSEKLAWLESGMPKQFSYCQMLLTGDSEGELKLIDLSIRPVDLLSTINPALLGVDEEKKSYARDKLLRYIMTYPLAAACSVKAKDRSCAFVEEYVFPQLLMQWVKGHETIDGIRYTSALSNRFADTLSDVNVVLPVKDYGANGLDRRLTSLFAISNVEYLDVVKVHGRYKDGLMQLEEFRKRLQAFLIEMTAEGNPFNRCTDYIGTLIESCKKLERAFFMLSEGRYEDLLCACSHIYDLQDYVDLLCKSQSMQIKNSARNASEEAVRNEIEAVAMALFGDFNELRSELFAFGPIDLGFKNFNPNEFEKLPS